MTDEEMNSMLAGFANRDTQHKAAERIKELETQLAEARELLAEAANDLTVYVGVEYPVELRNQYPSVQRKSERDMDLVYRINAKLTD